MRYLSFDIEATGLDEHDFMIEFAAVPFCTESKTIENSLTFHHYIKCPSFEELKPKLNPWVIENNEGLIKKAHSEGLEILKFKENFENYLQSEQIQNYFSCEKITLFGKSVSAIDLPFMNRDLGWNFMRDHFVHRQLDLSAATYALIDLNKLPKECTSGSALMKHFNMGEVAHTALEDAINTAKLYLQILNKFAQ
jgi:DNA polymerase-3 subunit epsilon